MKSIHAVLVRAMLIGLLLVRPLYGEIKPGTYQLARPATMEILIGGKIVGKMVLPEGRTIQLVSTDHDKGLVQNGTVNGYISITPGKGLFVGVEPSETSSDDQGKGTEAAKITPGTYQLARTVPLEILEGTKIVGKMDLSPGDSIQLVSVNGDKGLVHFGRDVTGYISLKPAEGLFADAAATKVGVEAQPAEATTDVTNSPPNPSPALQLDPLPPLALAAVELCHNAFQESAGVEYPHIVAALLTRGGNADATLIALGNMMQRDYTKPISGSSGFLVGSMGSG